MSDVITKKIIQLPVPLDVSDIENAKWLPVTELVAGKGHTRRTYRLPYPSGGNGVKIDANGIVQVKVDDKTIKIVDDTLVGTAGEIAPSERGAVNVTKTDNGVELAVIVDGNSIQINERGELAAKSSTSIDRGLTLTKSGAIEVNPGNGIGFDEGKQLIVKLSGPLSYDADGNIVLKLDNKLLRLNSDGEVCVNIAGAKDITTDDTIWTSKTTESKIAEAVKDIKVKVAYAESSAGSTDVNEGEAKIAFGNATLKDGITITDGVFTVPNTMKWITVNMQAVVTCPNYLSNAYDLLFSIYPKVGSTILDQYERNYTIDTTENMTYITYSATFIRGEWTEFTLNVSRPSDDEEGDAIEMSSDYKITVAGV